MDKLKETISRKIQDLGESLNSNDEDARMEDMSEFIVSPYAGSKSMELQQPCTSNSVTASKRCTAEVSTDDDVIDSIEASYFIEDDFDAIDYVLKKQIDSEIGLEELDRERLRLKCQLQVVSKKISKLIMEKSPSYIGQMKDVDEIHNGLGALIQEVRKIRRFLAQSKQRSSTSLGILANEKKKRMLRRLKSTLMTVKTLYETEYQLKDAIEDGQFPLAIRICVEAKEAANNYKHFNCVSDLMSKLVGTTSLIEHELDTALPALTIIFDLDRYIFVYNAYMMMHKVEPASRKLVQHFLTTIERSTTTVIREKLGSNPLAEYKETSYENLCEAVPYDSVVTSIRELCFVLCKILSIYHVILRYHTEESETKEDFDGETAPPGIMLSHLTSSLYSIFRAAVSRLNSLLCCQDLSPIKFDDILEIADMINRFRRFGAQYFGHTFLELALSLEKQTILYFGRYHRERLEELRMFMENESFTLCPVPHQFTIFDLQDFQFLKDSRDKRVDLLNSPLDGVGEALEFELLPPEYVNPFGKEQVKSRHASSYSTQQSVDDGLAGVSKEESSDECFEDADNHIPPNISNTALNLLRFFGRYIRMTSLLQSIAENSVPAVTQLFEFFFYSICQLFGRDGSDSMEQPARLLNILDDIRIRLGIDRSVEDYTQQPRLSSPSLCCAVNLNFPDQLYGAAERIIAIESVEFVARQLDLVCPVIEGLISDKKSTLLQSLDDFYSQVLSVVPLTRSYILDCAASKALKLPTLMQIVSNSKWDINELRSEHSAYVDFMIKDFEAFSLRLDTVGESVHISSQIGILLWDRVIFYAFRALVQGYCEGGNCTTEGRALMQLDFQHLQLKLEKICGLKPIPHVAYVDGYIKAYYLPEVGLEQWIGQHTFHIAKLTLANMRKCKKQRGNLMDQLKRRFIGSAVVAPTGFTIARTIATGREDATDQILQDARATVPGDLQTVGVGIISSCEMNMDMLGKLGDQLKQGKSHVCDLKHVDTTSDESSSEDDHYEHRRNFVARYENVAKRNSFDLEEDCRGCPCCCCPCKKKLLQYDEYKILLCGVTTGIQALLDRVKKEEEKSAEPDTAISRKLRRKILASLSGNIDDEAVLLKGPAYMRRKVANRDRLIREIAAKVEEDCHMLAKPSGPLWELEWKSKDELLAGMEQMGLLQFSKFVKNWCFYHSQIVTGPRKVTQEEYELLASLEEHEDIPFNSNKFDKLHNAAAVFSPRWLNMMRGSEDDDCDTLRQRSHMLLTHLHILDKFDFDKGMSPYDANMRALRLTHPCSNRVKIPDVECQICWKSLNSSPQDVVILLDAMQYIHFTCLYEKLKAPALAIVLRPK